MLKVKYRQFACDKCGAIHSIQTNHKGQIYNQNVKIGLVHLDVLTLHP